MVYVRIFLIQICFCFSLISSAKEGLPFSKWLNVPNNQLLTLGDTYLKIRNQPDSALLCYTIVANRCADSNSSVDKRNCITALLGKWQVYFLTYNNYKESFDCLYQAQEMSELIHQESAQIYYDFAAMYMDLSSQANDSSFLKKAIQNYKRAFELASNNGNAFVTDHSFLNLVMIAFDEKKPLIIQHQWEIYSRLPYKGKNSFRYCNQLLYKAHFAEYNHDFEKALNIYQQVITLLPKNFENSRSLYMAYMQMAVIYKDLDDYSLALNALKECENIAELYKFNDCRLLVLYTYYLIYNKMGDKSLSADMQKQYYELKDSLLSYQQLKSVEGQRFDYQIKKAGETIRTMEYKQRVQSLVTIMCVVVALIIILFLFLLYRKSQSLQKKNYELYKRARALIRDNVGKGELHDNVSIQDEGKDAMVIEKTTAGKKEDLKISTADQEYLIGKIDSIMNDPSIFCNPEFSAEQLAHLTGTKQRILSRLVKIKYGCNFNSFLGEKRIREALRRMDESSDFDNLTIEGISNSVGMRSRTTFITNFKRVTGLTPSEYIHIQKTQEKEDFVQ